MKYEQKINCSVGSCKFNDMQRQACTLQQIIVEPVVGKNTANTDESMCGSYENDGNNANL